MVEVTIALLVIYAVIATSITTYRRIKLYRSVRRHHYHTR